MTTVIKKLTCFQIHDRRIAFYMIIMCYIFIWFASELTHPYRFFIVIFTCFKDYEKMAQMHIPLDLVF